jgi:nucleotide-binding universal stress UspA family protein
VTRQDTAEGQLDVRYTLFSLARTIEQEDGISVRCDGLQVAYSPSLLADWLGSTPADLLLLPKPEHQSVATTTLNGLSELIRQTGLPVWFVEQDSRPEEGVVVAVSKGAEEASGKLRALDYEVMDVARGVGALFRSPLHLVQAAEDSTAAEELSLESFARATGATEEVDEILVADGDVPAVVAGSAESLQAGLIVMGASDRSGWDRVVRGGTAESTLNRAPCDVLYVKNAAGEHVRPQAVLSHAAMEEVPQPNAVDLMVHPRRYFATPLVVLRDEQLSRPQKVLILEAWEEELGNEAVQEARMPQQVYEATYDPAELDMVRQALVRLGERSGVQ